MKPSDFRFICLCAVLASSGCGKAVADVDLVGVVALGHYPLELHTPDGTLVERPPINEYKKLEAWDYHDGYSRPKTFDAAAIVFNGSGAPATGVVVEFELSAMVGGFDAQKEELRREQVRSLGTAVIGDVAANSSSSAVLSDIDLREIWMSYWKKDEWPYEIEITARLACGECSAIGVDTSRYTWTMQPGD